MIVMRAGMIIKVCGMRDGENIRGVESLGPDMMGFIFSRKSPRFVSKVPSYLPSCIRVGVFVDTPISEILSSIKTFDLDKVQLHGFESPEICLELSEIIGKDNVVKAFHIPMNKEVGMNVDELVEPYTDCCGMFLFDTSSSIMGGVGLKYDWNLLASYHGRTPFMLSGGIGPEDVANIKKFKHQSFSGIDLNSRFEISPAVKDIKLLKTFLEKL